MIRPEPDLVNKGPGTSPAHLEVVPQERQFAPDARQTSGYGQRLPVRLSRSVFHDLAIWMIGVGIIIGAGCQYLVDARSGYAEIACAR